MSSVRFILDDQLVEISDVEPTRTLLQYLREDRLLSGTKEGCAEGDCGACTVVLVELVDDSLRYRAVNACIQFLPTLDGKALFTVESLKSANGELHPVQQAMVDHHGSQCGFCTPGFVMSMFALYQNDADPDRETIDDALSGNLCRCTGYRPIVDACMHMRDYPEVPVSEAALIEQLRQLRRDTELSLESSSGKFHSPARLQELADRYAKTPDAQILAGGTDVGLWVTKQLRELPEIIYLGNVAELQSIRVTDNTIEIGAAVSLTDAVDELNKHYPEFGEMFRRFASVPIRNAGTLVGNIANGSPIGDSMPALITIGTRVRLRRGDQVRELALEDLYLDYMKNAMGPGEFVESVLVPLRDPDIQLRCYKLSKRFDQDISAVCTAFAARLDAGKVADIRIGVGGMAAVSKRASACEKFLQGKPWDEKTVRQAMQALVSEFSPLSDMRASADYRSRANANLLYRFYLETRANDPVTDGNVNVFAVGS